MRTTSPALATALLILGITWAAADEPAVSAILTSPRSRAAYLAHATMWKDPGDLSSDEILAGPSGVFPYSAAEALDGVGCTFVQPGKELGGKSAKFLCGPSCQSKRRSVRCSRRYTTRSPLPPVDASNLPSEENAKGPGPHSS